jgi:asparagine synthase (glutamine-hydrolysing)
LGLNLSLEDGSLADEHSFVEAIERAYNVTIHRIPLVPVRFMDGIERVSWHQETPILDLQWKDAEDIFQTSRQLGARVLLTGHWGDDVLTAWDYLIDLFHRGAWGQVWAHLNEFHLWNTDVITPRLFLRKFARNLLKYHIPEAVRQPIRRLRGKFSPPQWDRPWYTAALRQRGYEPQVQPDLTEQKFANLHVRGLYQGLTERRAISTMETHNKWAAMVGMEIAFPMMDRDLIGFIMAIPGEVCNWQGIPRNLLRRAMKGVLPQAIATRRWKGDFSSLVNNGMKREIPKLSRYVRSGMLAGSFGYVDDDLAVKEIQQMQSSLLTKAKNCEISWSIALILALEVWLQVFFKDSEK